MHMQTYIFLDLLQAHNNKHFISINYLKLKLQLSFKFTLKNQCCTSIKHRACDTAIEHCVKQWFDKNITKSTSGC